MIADEVRVLQDEVNRLTKELEESRRINQQYKFIDERLYFVEQLAQIGFAEFDFRTNEIWMSDLCWSIFDMEKGETELTVEMWNDIVHPDDRAEVYEKYLAAAQTPDENLKSSVELTFRIFLKDGSIKYIHELIDIFFSENKVPVRNICVFKDITQKVIADKKRKEQQDKIHLHNKMSALGQLVSGITHDFNNVLGTVISGAEYFSGNAKLNDEEKLAANNIIDAGMHASDLTKQLLGFSKQNTSEKRLVDISEVIKSTVQMLTSASTPNLDINVNLSANEQIVLADRSMLQSALLNICLNAVDALKDTDMPRISITVNKVLSDTPDSTEHDIDDAKTDFTRVTISNNGPQIADVNRDKLFEPFFTTKNETDNVGLGLAITYSTITEMDGQIFVDSPNDGDTSFSIYLPVIDGVSISNKNEDNQTINGCGTILFVDDDDAFRINVSYILRGLGYTVDQCSSVAEALEKYSRKQYDLIFSDMIMPGANGIELFEQIRANHSEAKFILLSGNTGTKELPRNFPDKFSMQLNKPILSSTLSQAIHKLLSQ